MISYWKNTKEFYDDAGLSLIYGWYDHEHKDNGGYKALGVHWGTYPHSRGGLSPCVIPETTRNAILAGLLHQAVIKGHSAVAKSIIEAIDFFREP